MQQSFDDLCVCDPVTARSRAEASLEEPKGCHYCSLEKEKRQVTQKAFERAMNISLFLIEEIERIGPKGSGSPCESGLHVSKQEILGLLKTGRPSLDSEGKTRGCANLAQTSAVQGYLSPQQQTPSMVRFNRSLSYSGLQGSK